MKTLMCLTRALKSLDHKQILFSKVLPDIHFTPVHSPMINDYPTWVHEHKSWAYFGTVVDYVIRKMIRNFASKRTRGGCEVLEEKELIADIGLRLINSIVSKDEFEENLFHENFQLGNGNAFFIRNDISKKEREIIDNFKNSGSTWISRYKSNLSWEDCLIDTFKLAQIDEYYRSLSLSSRFPGEMNVLKCLPFFRKLDAFLQVKFSSIRKFLLNPCFGSVFSADADMVADNVMVEIKTIRNPNNKIQDSVFQLLGYAGLIEYNKFMNIEYDGRIGEHSPFIEKIAVINPLYLSYQEVSIKNWSVDLRIQYIELMKKLILAGMKED